MDAPTSQEHTETTEPDKARNPPDINFRGYIPELDGLRAGGISLVLINHLWPASFSYLIFQLGNLGWIAMDSFFVMSGFLITGLLLDSRQKPNYFSTYYARRSLRIFPLYYAILLAWHCITRYTNHGIDYYELIQHWGSPAWFIFYVGNIRQAIVGYPHSLGDTLVLAYAPLWSLQVEEQFYVLFPFAVAFLRPKHLRGFLIAGIVCSPILRVLAYLWQPDNPYLQYIELPTHCEGLALGALIAIRLRSGPWNISRPSLTALTVLFLGSACAGSLLSTWGTYNPAWGTLWDRLAGSSISAIGCACLLLWLICFRGSNYTSWLRLAPVRYLSKISYGLYLLHMLAIWVVLELGKKGFIHFRKDDWRFSAAALVLSFTLATLSWYCLEAPLLKIKKRFTYERPKAVTNQTPA